MSALAEQWESVEPDAPQAGAREIGRRSRPAGTSASHRRSGQRQDPSWNVLAEQIVAFPSRATELFVDRRVGAAPASDDTPQQYAEAWLHSELSRLRERRLEVRTSFDRLDGSLPPERSVDGSRRRGQPASAPTPERETARRQRPAHIAVERLGDLHDGVVSTSQSPSGRARDLSRAAVRPRTRSAATEQRGLRRFLPGAATLVVLAATWLGVGALSSAGHEVQVRVLPGSVLVGGHADYVARPGDTLWSIATRVEPGADPRPLVDELQAQLHDKVLQPGDTLVLPR